MPDLFHCLCPSGISSGKEAAKVREKKQFTGKDIFLISREGLDYIWHQKDIFFLLLVASGVNFLRLLSFYSIFQSTLRGQGGLGDHLNVGELLIYSRSTCCQ